MPRSDATRVIAPDVPRDVAVPIATGTVRLTDDPDGSTTVWVNEVPSSSMRLDPTVLDFEYMRHFAAAIAAWGPPAKLLALHAGAGVCTMARHLSHAYPDSRHIAVDIDTTLPDLARQWWDLPRAPQLRVRAQDGSAAVVERHDDSLDLILRDAFAGDSTPVSMADEHWWTHARRVVRPGGLVLANVKYVPQQRNHAPDVAAARAIFRDVVAVGEPAVLKGKRRGNVVIVASDGIDLDALRRYAASAPLPTGVDPSWPGQR
ncbi:spermidine synthase [Demequina sp.]|uniref:spermidine synthase n=1 Tax=Demequina sp. TaxID=2050685 RepID=UPI003A89FBE3